MCEYAQMLQWDDLKYVLAIHEHGGLSGAGRALGVNHSTVSRRLAAIEAQMNARLFERFSTGLEATAAGQKAIKAAQQMEAQVLDLEVAVAGQDRQLQGQLKVSAPQLIIKVVLAEIFKEFCVRYPKIELTIIATSDAVNLHRREADVSILASNTPDETLWGRKILSQNCRYYGAGSYLESLSDHNSLDCLNFLWRGDEPAEQVRDAFDNARVLAKFDDMVAVLGAVEAGMGIARMPCFLGDSNPTLRALAAIEPEPYSDIWLLTHPDLKSVARIELFMNFVKDRLIKRQDLFLGETAGNLWGQQVE